MSQELQRGLLFTMDDDEYALVVTLRVTHTLTRWQRVLAAVRYVWDWPAHEWRVVDSYAMTRQETVELLHGIERGLQGL